MLRAGACVVLEEAVDGGAVEPTADAGVGPGPSTSAPSINAVHSSDPRRRMLATKAAAASSDPMP